ncbi:ladderlectin-like isoform X3 [Neolamprologus brichardi]|uniref:Lectin-like n=1 Tax=Neolamprologus brichardi TaxID=32507 RepID=A0A3Q4G3H9_NEOBR|nr:ladderlectin-like isoform X3 [Neolamprologus brichardi]
MKLVTVSALLCAMITLIVAAEEGAKEERSSEHLVEKRGWLWYSHHGWYKYGKRYYRYFPYRLDWAHAQRYCQSMRANLASVRNLREYRVIQSVIYRATHGYPTTWIGGSDAQRERYWFWADGTPFSFTYWCRGEPNNVRRREHCLHMNFSRYNCMNDIYCQYRYPYVCVWKRR